LRQDRQEAKSAKNANAFVWRSWPLGGLGANVQCDHVVDEKTLHALAEFVARFERPCCLCAPMAGK